MEVRGGSSEEMRQGAGERYRQVVQAGAGEEYQDRAVSLDA
jgi:hypothetical protein